MFETKTIGKARADELIKAQPYFDKQQYQDIFCRTASYAARQMMEQMQAISFYHRKLPVKQRIKQQLFYHGGKPEEFKIKFRRPVATVMDKVIDDAITHGRGMIRIEPHKICEVGEISDRTAKHSQPVKCEPIYTLDDICWKSYA